MIVAPDSVRKNYNRINKSPDTTLGGCGAELRLTLCRLGPIYGQVLLGPAPQLPRVFCVHGIGAHLPIGAPGRLRLKKGCRCSVSGDGVAYAQNRHQGRAGAALRAVWANSRCNWSISPDRVVNWASRLSIRAFSSSTNMPSLVPPSGGGVLGGVGGVSGIVTTHRKPWAVFSLLPESVPARSRRRTVSVETPRCPAASEILTFIPNSLVVDLLKRIVNDYTCLGRFVAVPA